jgi:hypothetical protein
MIDVLSCELASHNGDKTLEFVRTFDESESSLIGLRVRATGPGWNEDWVSPELDVSDVFGPILVPIAALETTQQGLERWSQTRAAMRCDWTADENHRTVVRLCPDSRFGAEVERPVFSLEYATSWMQIGIQVKVDQTCIDQFSRQLGRLLTHAK